jgi:methanethiol S-methyltransferase
MNEYVLLSIFWTVFYASHSFLADNFVKKKMQNILLENYKYYRIIYNIISIISLVLILKFQLSINENKLFFFGVFQNIIALILVLSGIIVQLFAFKVFNKREFLGIEQLSINNDKIDKMKILIISGLYAYVRHPLYFGIILFSLGLLLFLANFSIILFNIITFAYLIVGTKLEEKKLIQEFGEDYKQYQKNVKMLIPYVL